MHPETRRDSGIEKHGVDTIPESDRTGRPRMVDVTGKPVTARRAVAEFHATHERIYGHARPGHPVEVVNVRTVHATLPPPVALAPPPEGGSLARALEATRPAWFEELSGWRDTPVYRRDRLPIDEPVEGPAIVEQPDTTTVVYPGQVCRVEASGNMRITVRQE